MPRRGRGAAGAPGRAARTQRGGGDGEDGGDGLPAAAAPVAGVATVPQNVEAAEVVAAARELVDRCRHLAAPQQPLLSYRKLLEEAGRVVLLAITSVTASSGGESPFVRLQRAMVVPLVVPSNGGSPGRPEGIVDKDGRPSLLLPVFGGAGPAGSALRPGSSQALLVATFFSPEALRGAELGGASAAAFVRHAASLMAVYACVVVRYVDALTRPVADFAAAAAFADLLEASDADVDKIISERLDGRVDAFFLRPPPAEAAPAPTTIIGAAAS